MAIHGNHPQKGHFSLTELESEFEEGQKVTAFLLSMPPPTATNAAFVDRPSSGKGNLHNVKAKTIISASKYYRLQLCYIIFNLIAIVIREYLCITFAMRRTCAVSTKELKIFYMSKLHAYSIIPKSFFFVMYIWRKMLPFIVSKLNDQIYHVRIKTSLP